jgi:2-oxoglutarate dehydrogenase E2 component (dihydrolipoamide succinyltransferase)
MPHMGVSVEEGTVLAWHKAEGDEVRADEVVCEISTDKVDTEVLAPADGVLARIVAAVGDTVPVGEPLAMLAVEGEVGAPAAEANGSPPAPAKVAEAPAAVATAPADHRPRRFDPVAAAEAVVPEGRGPVSSPVARRLAAEHDIDIATVQGTGIRGRIRKADVLAAMERPAPAAAPATPSTHWIAGLLRGYVDVPREVVPLTPVRRAMAEHMLRSRQTAAHMTTEAEVDMSAVQRARAAANPAREAAGRGRLSPLAYIARAACAALQEFPDLNATFDGTQLIRWREVNLGIAVDTERGLLVPVVRGAERLTAEALADAIADAAAVARGPSLTPDHLRAGTFTISNPGSVGGISAMAIINQPQVAILGTPAIVRRPVVVDDGHGGEAIAIRPLMTLALTYDHRVIDGAYATRCVVRIKQLLEDLVP